MSEPKPTDKELIDTFMNTNSGSYIEINKLGYALALRLKKYEALAEIEDVEGVIDKIREVNFIKEIRVELENSLRETPEMNNFECEYGFRLGECTNPGCLPCVVLRVVEKIKGKG